MSIKRWLTSIRQVKTLLLEVIIPIILIIAGLALANVQFFRDPPSFSIQPTDVFKSSLPFPVGINSTDITETQALSFVKTFSSVLDPFIVAVTPSKTTHIDFDNYIFDHPTKIDQFGSVLISSMSTDKGYEMIIYGNMTYRDSLPMFLQTAISAILKDVTQNPDASFTVKP